ncbi:flagellar assembly protein FlgT [Vibrio sp.]|nr:flagellar assembly protein FlgT [Vibrio sp.]
MFRTLSLLFGLVSASFYSSAAWYEATGIAPVVTTTKAARLSALEDALYKAVSFSGADIGGISNLRSLLEEGQDEYKFTNHEIRHIVIDKEKTRNDKVHLTVLFNIYPVASSCHTDQYKKSLLFGDFQLLSPQQARMGQLYHLGTDFSRILSRRVNSESMNLLSVGESRYDFNKRYPERMTMMAQDSNAQYLINGDIVDLTATVNDTREEAINRQFAMVLRVYDGKTGHEIFNKNYRKVATWEFAKTSQVDTKSARFWESSYGTMVRNISRDVMLDLESELSCRITLPEIVAKFGDTVTIDLGRIHGVERGDKLSLWHTGSFIDQHGLTRTKVTESDITLTVNRVYENEAELDIEQTELGSSIQIGDVLTTYRH